MRSSACARHFILQSKIQNKITRHVTAPPDGESHRAVFQVCHCAPPDAAGFPDLSLRALRSKRGNLAVPGWIMGKLPAKSQLPSRDSHVASLLGMTSRRCVSFEQWPVLIGSACRALSVTFGDSSPRGRAMGALLLGMTSRRCVPFEQRPELIGSACRALSVTFGDSSPRGRAMGALLPAITQ